MHISTLFGDYSIGNFGDEAKYFVDFLDDCGFSYWQVLPFCMTDANNSPYKAYSSFSLNPYFISPKKLFDKNLISAEELGTCCQKTPYVCEFERLSKERLLLLKKASLRVENREEVEKFAQNNPHIKNFCEFMARKDANLGAPWNKWTTSKIDDEELFMWKFIQYEFFSEWNEIKQYANSKGIKIIGDIPIYVDYDSSDVCNNQKYFQLDEKGNPKNVAGVPPDYFASEGQLWGNPLYDYDEMKKDNFSFWSDRIKHNLRLFDAVRIDHFRAFDTYWSIPALAKSAKEGKWIQSPGKDIINCISEISEDKLIIAEDLGEITESVRKLVDYSGFPGMRVFQFAFTGDCASPHLPHNYIENCVAYTGTHDNNTLLGHIWEIDEKTREKIFSYCSYRGSDWSEACGYVVEELLRSHAGLAILPIQDLLVYGADTRMNVPGCADGNWGYRLTREQLDSIDREKYNRLNRLFGRK